MGSTPQWGLPWPEGNESNDVEAHIKALAQAVERSLNSIYAFADTMLPWGIVYPLALTTVIPPNMIVLRGQTGLPVENYRKLANLLGVTSGAFSLPDMRGVTVRGVATQIPGGITGSDQFTLNINQLPPHNHPWSGSITGNHDHDGAPGYDFVVSSPVEEQNWAVGLAERPGGPGNMQLTTSRDRLMANNTMGVTGSVGVRGAGEPVTFIPRSMLVHWVTRAS